MTCACYNFLLIFATVVVVPVVLFDVIILRTFLLEKIRLVHTSEGERNFHIFYLMLAGTTAEQKEALHLTDDPRVYHYINQSSCYERRDGVMDADLWTELNKAMQVRTQLLQYYWWCCFQRH